ncbi:MAG TPA: OsmC family protein, partial [Verrucomicrobiae bacterium]|nr:OsmC family protein [Verrucomicrobiae bacterium]
GGRAAGGDQEALGADEMGNVMEMKISFPGGKRVDAEFDGFTVRTDQGVAAGGERSAPTPFEVFLSSIGTCAGIYVLTFCRERGIDTTGLAINQRIDLREVEGKRRAVKVSLEIVLPPGFPEKYRNAVVKAAELCTVKKALLNPPEFEITTA